MANNSTSTMSSMEVVTTDATPPPFYLHYWDSPPHQVIIYGFIVPILSILTIVANIIICVILYRIHRQSPTNLLLIAIAVSDTLTGLFPLVPFVYLFGFGNYMDYVQYEWCFPTLVLSTIFHTSSMWLTVTLAIQRYVGIRDPTSSRRWFSRRNTVVIILAITFAAFMTHIVRFFEDQYIPVSVPSRLYSYKNISACQMVPKPWNTMLYKSVFFILRLIFIQVLPCTLLVVMNGLLIYSIKKAKKLRKILSPSFKNRRYNFTPRGSGSTRMTTMLIVIIGITLFVEIIATIIMIIVAIDPTSEILFMVAPVSNLLLFMSYPSNFIIYCTMSAKFRLGFHNMFQSSVKMSQDLS